MCVLYHFRVSDIIFCIYLYQRWIYRVDPKRVNEFGTSGEMADQPEALTSGTEEQNGAVVHTATADEQAPVTPAPSSAKSPRSAPSSHRTKSNKSKKKDW